MGLWQKDWWRVKARGRSVAGLCGLAASDLGCGGYLLRYERSGILLSRKRREEARRLLDGNERSNLKSSNSTRETQRGEGGIYMK